MIAHKCDRCGMFYLGNEKYHPRGEKKTAIEGLTTIQTWGKRQLFELCDDCLTEFFEKFMKGGGNGNVQAS